MVFTHLTMADGLSQASVNDVLQDSQGFIWLATENGLDRYDGVNVRRFKLEHVRKNTAARCSGGEKRRLEIARCLVCEPLLILLDEPFAAVDPITTEDIRRNIRELGGRVEIESALGIGTRISVRLPLTLAILDGMSVGVSGETFIVPLRAIR